MHGQDASPEARWPVATRDAAFREASLLLQHPGGHSGQHPGLQSLQQPGGQFRQHPGGQSTQPPLWHCAQQVVSRSVVIRFVITGDCVNGEPEKNEIRKNMEPMLTLPF